MTNYCLQTAEIVYPKIAAFMVHLRMVGHSHHLSRQNLFKQHQHIRALTHLQTNQLQQKLILSHLARKFVSKLLYIMFVTANAMQIGTKTRHYSTKGLFLASLH